MEMGCKRNNSLDDKDLSKPAAGCGFNTWFSAYEYSTKNTFSFFLVLVAPLGIQPITLTVLVLCSVQKAPQGIQLQYWA